jgi:hypothetical protein
MLVCCVRSLVISHLQLRIASGSSLQNGADSLLYPMARTNVTLHLVLEF